MSTLVRSLANLVAVTFARRNVQPPGQLYVAQDDWLYLVVQTRSGVARLDIAVRLLTPSGEITTLAYQFLDNVPDEGLERRYPLLPGFILGIQVKPALGFTFNRGDVFVTCGIARGNLPAGVQHAVLFQDYVAGHEWAGWPGGRYVSSLDGQGLLTPATGDAPGAGADHIFTPSFNGRFRLHSLVVDFTTDATVASRLVGMELRVGANAFGAVYSINLQTAGLTDRYEFNRGGIAQSQQLPPGPGRRHNLPILPGDFDQTATVVVRADNRQAGDTFGIARWWIEEWIDPQ